MLRSKVEVANFVPSSSLLPPSTQLKSVSKTPTQETQCQDDAELSKLLKEIDHVRNWQSSQLSPQWVDNPYWNGAKEMSKTPDSPITPPGSPKEQLIPIRVTRVRKSSNGSQNAPLKNKRLKLLRTYSVETQPTSDY
jgi:hypothetical protein